MKNKKLLSILLILIVGIILYFGYNTFLAPKGVEGLKEVTIQIIINSQNINETFTYKSDQEFLYELMKEKEDALKASFEETSLGNMVTGLMGYTANPASEYFHILINNEDSMTGVDEIPLADKDKYILELREF
ncbi:MAG TPA: DUF4430 domain-containing protein [Eubacteriaceae bacterium]|jgi:energy-coupling factor transport system substrate-specific component|nr:DUF4430 domain-containing protein [Eubacteriaceae bacterium]